MWFFLTPAKIPQSQGQFGPFKPSLNPGNFKKALFLPFKNEVLAQLPKGKAFPKKGQGPNPPLMKPCVEKNLGIFKETFFGPNQVWQNPPP